MKVLDDLSEVVADWTGCQDCTLHEKRANQVWYRHQGDPTRGLMIIGEAPGVEEDRQGKPFVGPSGQKLEELLERAGIEAYLITNVVACRPPNNRAPTRKECSLCWPRLYRMIDAVAPSVVICAGNVAAHWILETDKTMGSMVQKVFRWCSWFDREPVILPIYHPAYLLRNQSAEVEAIVVKRLKKAKEFLNADNPNS